MASSDATAVVAAEDKESSPPSSGPTANNDDDKNDLLYWTQRWTDQRTGWHSAHVNAVLQAHGDKLLSPRQEEPSESGGGGGGGIRVLVPLCGKTVDMAYFANRDVVSDVVGCDGAELALTQFAQEHAELKIVKQEQDGDSGDDGDGEKQQCTNYQVYKGEKITLLQGDFFALTKKDTDGKLFDAVLDRGSMVAIQPALRTSYVQTLQRLLAPRAKILLVAVEHDNKGEGPPFCLLEEEIRQLFLEGETDWMESMTQLNPENTEKDERGRLSRWYLLQVKGPLKREVEESEESHPSKKAKKDD